MNIFIKVWLMQLFVGGILCLMVKGLFEVTAHFDNTLAGLVRAMSPVA